MLVKPLITIHITNLQEKSDAGPRKGSVNRIILNGRVNNLLEKIDPLDNLAEQVCDNDCLSTISFISPSFLDTLLLRLYCKLVEVGQDV